MQHGHKLNWWFVDFLFQGAKLAAKGNKNNFQDETVYLSFYHIVLKKVNIDLCE